MVHKKNKRFFARIADPMFNFCRHKKMLTRTNFPPLSVDISFSLAGDNQNGVNLGSMGMYWYCYARRNDQLADADRRCIFACDQGRCFNTGKFRMICKLLICCSKKPCRVIDNFFSVKFEQGVKIQSLFWS